MKILARDEESLTLLLDRRERELLLFLLRRYPVVDPTQRQLASPQDRDALAAEQQFLIENLTAEQSAQRTRVERFIRERLTDPPPGAGSGASAVSARPLRVLRSEADWLLRVINDVRVGCWMRLGCPGEDLMHSPKLAARNVTDFAAMELGGLVQSILLEALHG